MGLDPRTSNLTYSPRIATKPPTPLDDATRRRFEAQRVRDTEPELALRRELHRRGYRYRLDRRVSENVRSRPDLVFTSERVAVYVDGCFWHGCPDHGTAPKNNADWWQNKLDANRARDEQTNTALTDEGWTVIRVWEHELPETAATRVAAAVDSAR